MEMIERPERFTYTLGKDFVEKITRFEESMEQEKKEFIKKYNPELYKERYGNI